MEKANETLLNQVQRRRIERRRGIARINENHRIIHMDAKRKLPSEIEDNDITWSEILKDAGKIVFGLMMFLIFMAALISLAFFIPA